MLVKAVILERDGDLREPRPHVRERNRLLHPRRLGGELGEQRGRAQSSSVSVAGVGRCRAAGRG